MKLAKRLVTTAAGFSLAVALAACAGTPTAPPLTDAQVVENNRIRSEQLVAQAQELVANNQIKQAIVYKEAISLYSKRFSDWYNLGILCNREMRYAEAVEAWRIAADMGPQDPRPYFALGLQYQEVGRYGDAADCYNRSLEIQPDYLPALKKSVEIDQFHDRYTDVTLQRIRTALLLETDPKWVEYLRRNQMKAEERVARAGGNTGR
jgi:tetratricopeptide (TPR) repeat protein